MSTILASPFLALILCLFCAGGERWWKEDLIKQESVQAVLPNIEHPCRRSGIVRVRSSLEVSDPASYS